MRRVAIPVAAFVAIAAGPLGHRAGLLPLGAALLLLLAGILTTLAWLAVRVIAALRRRGTGFGNRRALAAGLLSAGALGVPLANILPALGAPPIHDITTDPDDPPRFEAVVPLRAGAPNPLEYGGPQLAATQRAAYPDVLPLTVGASPSAALEAARSVATDHGWEIVTVDPARGVIEATATTFWFGFKDDVAVRIRPGESGGAAGGARGGV